MKLIATRKSEQNRAAVDPWTLVHFSMGLAAGLMATPFSGALAASVAYELVEQFLERRRVGKEVFNTTKPESAVNAVTDVIVFAAGHRVGEMWNES